MHPDIKAFWERNGYTVETDVILGNGEDPFILYWFLVDKDGGQLHSVGASDPYDRGSEAYKRLGLTKEDPPCTDYHWDGESYSEAEMLRIIRLKAFL